MALLSSLLLSLTSLPSISVFHLLFTSFFFVLFSVCLSFSLWAVLQFTWWADGQQTNIGPGPRQAERTQSSRAEQQGCYITFPHDPSATPTHHTSPAATLLRARWRLLKDVRFRQNDGSWGETSLRSEANVARIRPVLKSKWQALTWPLIHHHTISW